MRLRHLSRLLIGGFALLLIVGSFALAQSADPTPERYIVRGGDTLSTIALRFGITTRALAEYNDLANLNFVYSGQILLIPPRDGAERANATPVSVPQRATQAPPANMPARPTEAAPPAADSNATPGQPASATPSATPTATPIAVDQASAGVVVLLDADANIPQLVQQAQALGVTWVGLSFDWSQMEPTPGTYDFDLADAAVLNFGNAGFRILATLTRAPDWARPSATTYTLQRTSDYGPPDDLAVFAAFVGVVAARYAGQIDAYEIWEQPNLRRTWIDPQSTGDDERRMAEAMYIDLLRPAYAAIKAADPNAFVITGGLAPTGFNDQINAIDDRVFLRELLQQGVLAVSDGIGAHPHGFGNPPDARAPQQAPGVTSHYDNTRFFFRDTLTEYREILQVANASDTPIWVTRFGWGSAEANPLAEPILPYERFLTFNDAAEQAAYNLEAFAVAQTVGNIGPMLLDNLNGCPLGVAQACYYSLLDVNGSPRTAYITLQQRLSQ